MKRSAVALGASVLALALGAGTAQADPVATQTVGDTTGAAQVGAVEVNAPVRVASDGDDQAASVTTSAPQTTNDSTGGAQVSSVDADAPVRVLSDGDSASNETPAGAATPGQSIDDSSGAAQVGSPTLAAPVRVASDGDDTSAGFAGDSSGGAQDTGDSVGAAQVGSPGVDAPVRLLSEGDSVSARNGASEDGPSIDGSTAAAQFGSPAVSAPIRFASAGDDVIAADASANSSGVEGTPFEDDTGGTGPTTTPILQFTEEGSSPDPMPVVDLTGGDDDQLTGDSVTLGVASGELPLTGLGLVAVVIAGMSLLSSGAALRQVH